MALKYAAFVISYFFVYWFCIFPILLYYEVFKKNSIISYILFFIVFLILLAAIVCCWKRHGTTKKQKALLRSESYISFIMDKRSKELSILSEESKMMGQKARGVREDNLIVEDNNQIKKTQSDKSVCSKGKGSTLENSDSNLGSFDGQGPANLEVVTHEINVKHEKYFQDVNFRKKYDLKNFADPKRFTFHGMSDNLAYMKEFNLPLEHAQVSYTNIYDRRRNSAIELDSIEVCFTPKTPRERFFSDLYIDAEIEEKRRSVLDDTVVLDYEEQEDENPIHSDVKKRLPSRLPSVVELIEKNGNRLSLRESVALSELPASKVDDHDVDDDVFEVPRRSISEYFVGDECILLPNQVMIPPMNTSMPVTSITSPALFYLSLPIKLEFGAEPDCLLFVPDLSPVEGSMATDQVVDTVRHIYLGHQPLVVKQCCRCGGKTQVQSSTRPAAIRAWDLRWARSCRCAGHWRIQKYT